MNLFKPREELDQDKYFIATYKAKSKTTLSQLAWDIAVGQSVGNPSIRNKWEDDELYQNHSCLILNNKVFTHGFYGLAVFLLRSLNIGRKVVENKTHRMIIR